MEYQKAKVDLRIPVGIPAALLTPSNHRETIENNHMDFFVDLLIDQNYITVLIMVDYFSKMCIIVPLSSNSAEHVA